MSTSGRKYITSVLLRTTIENEWGKLRKLSSTIFGSRAGGPGTIPGQCNVCFVPFPPGRHLTYRAVVFFVLISDWVSVRERWGELYPRDRPSLLRRPVMVHTTRRQAARRTPTSARNATWSAPSPGPGLHQVPILVCTKSRYCSAPSPGTGLSGGLL
jgi:hypothetical protein